jgi:hypothetical protein
MRRIATGLVASALTALTACGESPQMPIMQGSGATGKSVPHDHSHGSTSVDAGELSDLDLTVSYDEETQVLDYVARRAKAKARFDGLLTSEGSVLAERRDGESYSYRLSRKGAFGSDAVTTEITDTLAGQTATHQVGVERATIAAVDDRISIADGLRIEWSGDALWPEDQISVRLTRADAGAETVDYAVPRDWPDAPFFSTDHAFTIPSEMLQARGSGRYELRLVRSRERHPNLSLTEIGAPPRPAIPATFQVEHTSFVSRPRVVTLTP